jgi:adenylate cyclase class IV
VTVRKQRTVAIWRSTRIHLDQVEGLGQFVELETVLGNAPEGDAVGRVEFDDVVGWLGLASLEAIPGSYSDLLIAKGQPA